MKKMLLILAAAGALLVVAGFLMTVRVPEGAVGVVRGDGPAGAATTLPPGLHMRPLGAAVTIYRPSSTTAGGEVMVTPVAGGEIPLTYSVTATVAPDRLGELGAAIAGRPIEEFLTSQAAALLRDYASRSDAVDILTPRFREDAGKAVAEAMERGGCAEAALTIKPPDDDTLLAATQYLASRGEAFKVRQTISEAMLDPERARSWKLLTAMGFVNQSEKQFAEAERNFLDALALEPSALPPMAELVTLYSAAGDWSKLRRILDAALTADPKSLQHLNWAAMVLLRQDDLEGAERLLKQGLALDPAHTTLLANLGGLYLKTNRIPEALEMFKKAVDAAPQNQQALFNLGSALAATDRSQEALPYLERAEQAGRMTFALARTLAVVHDRLGDKAKASAYQAQAKELEAAEPSRRPKKPAQGRDATPRTGAPG